MKLLTKLTFLGATALLLSACGTDEPKEGDIVVGGSVITEEESEELKARNEGKRKQVRERAQEGADAVDKQKKEKAEQDKDEYLVEGDFENEITVDEKAIIMTMAKEWENNYQFTTKLNPDTKTFYILPDERTELEVLAKAHSGDQAAIDEWNEFSKMFKQLGFGFTTFTREHRIVFVDPENIYEELIVYENGNISYNTLD